MEIEELKAAYRKGDNFAFDSIYPVDRTIRSQLRNVKLMVNQMRRLAQIRILAFEILLKIADLDESEISYFRNEIDEVKDESKWGDLVGTCREVDIWYNKVFPNTRSEIKAAVEVEDEEQ